MWASEFDYLDVTKSLEVCLLLNNLIDCKVESIEQISQLLKDIFHQDIYISLQEVLTNNNEGPIYQYIATIDNIPICLYVGDIFGAHLIIGVMAGHQATYINENVKNMIKGSVI